MSKIKEVFENAFVGIIAIVLILGLVLSGISFISGVTSTAKSKYLIRVENHKYYTDEYSGGVNYFEFTDARTKKKVTIYGCNNVIIEERIHK